MQPLVLHTFVVAGSCRQPQTCSTQWTVEIMPDTRICRLLYLPPPNVTLHCVEPICFRTQIPYLQIFISVFSTIPKNLLALFHSALYKPSSCPCVCLSIKPSKHMGGDTVNTVIFPCILTTALNGDTMSASIPGVSTPRKESLVCI